MTHEVSGMLPVEGIGPANGFRRLDALHGVLVDLRYAGTNNFAGIDLYRGMDCGWLRAEAADGLEAAAGWLQRERPGWRILLLDALRPQRVQEAIWRDVAGTEMEHYFADPRRGSIHSYGMAVDVTLRDPQGREADMGSGFDEMTSASHPALHAELLQSGRLTPAHVAERECLRQAMAHGGFHGIPNEWWHFDHGDRERVRRELPRIW